MASTTEKCLLMGIVRIATSRYIYSTVIILFLGIFICQKSS